MDRLSFKQHLRSDSGFMRWIKTLISVVRNNRSEFLIVITEQDGSISRNVNGLDLNDDIIPDTWMCFVPWIDQAKGDYIKRSIRVRDGTISEKSRRLGFTLTEREADNLRKGMIVKQKGKDINEYNAVLSLSEIKDLLVE